jgi:hypothetical protein
MPDTLDFSTNSEEPLLQNNVYTQWDIDNDLPDALMSSRLHLGLSPADWIDETDISMHDLHPIELPTLLHTAHDDLDCKETSDATPTHALSALDGKINELGITKTEFYDRFRSQTTIDTNNGIRAHFDSGSMASTTDQLHCLWFYTELSQFDSVRTLQVADNHQHRPTGIGFLCLPTSSNEQHFIRCLYTPTLPATIVSPHDAGIQYNCDGYSCASNFDGSNCSIRFHFPSDLQ